MPYPEINSITMAGTVCDTPHCGVSRYGPWAIIRIANSVNARDTETNEYRLLVTPISCFLNGDEALLVKEKVTRGMQVVVTGSLLTKAYYKQIGSINDSEFYINVKDIDIGKAPRRSQWSSSLWNPPPVDMTIRNTDTPPNQLNSTSASNYVDGYNNGNIRYNPAGNDYNNYANGNPSANNYANNYSNNTVANNGANNANYDNKNAVNNPNNANYANRNGNNYKNNNNSNPQPTSASNTNNSNNKNRGSSGKYYNYTPPDVEEVPVDVYGYQ